MNEHLIVNQRENNLENKSVITALNTRYAPIKSSNQMKCILIYVLPNHRQEHERNGKSRHINGKILAVVKCNTYYIVCLYDFAKDSLRTYGVNLNAWGKIEIRTRTKKPNFIKISEANLLTTFNPVPEFLYLCSRLATDAPLPRPIQVPDVIHLCSRLVRDASLSEPKPTPEVVNLCCSLATDTPSLGPTLASDEGMHLCSSPALDTPSPRHIPATSFELTEVVNSPSSLPTDFPSSKPIPAPKDVQLCSSVAVDAPSPGYIPATSSAPEVVNLPSSLASDFPSSKPIPAPEVVLLRSYVDAVTPAPGDILEQPRSSVTSATPTLFSRRSSHIPVALLRSRSAIYAPSLIFEDEDENYNPFENRFAPHPTTDSETLIHLMKGSLGTGILAMPDAFLHAGLLFGLIATFFVGLVCAYCIHNLVKCSHKLCWRLKVPCLGYDDIAEVAFFVGPIRTRRFATFARFIVNFFLVLDLLGCCCVYIVFVAKNAKQVIDVYLDREMDLRHIMVCLLPLLIVMNLIPHLKYLAPFSMVANVLMATGMIITFYYIFHDLPPLKSRPMFSSVVELPIFFGTAIFALEGIGVVMPLENTMKTPTHFISCPGVLNIGMFFVVMLYSCVGFFGYLKYGEVTEPSITLNLPDEILAQAVKLMIAVAIFLTYSLQFYVPIGVIHRAIQHKYPNHPVLGESILRITFVIMTVVIAVLVPNLGPFISLVGAVCLSFLGLILPSIIEIVVCCVPEDSLGFGYWILWKNLAIILFGIVGFFTGTYTSILDIIAEQKSSKNQ